MDFSSKIKEAIKNAVGSDVEIELTHPTVAEHGDYATNVAMTIGGNPMEKAEEIREGIRELETSGLVEKIEVAKPGFINFTLSKDALLDGLMQFAQDENFGVGGDLQGRKIMIEYTDPNPFKEFHIGHLFTNAVGESLARLFEFQGAEVKRANYQGDVGLHVAKAVYGFLRVLPRAFSQENPQGVPSWEPLLRVSPAERAKVLGQAYALGARAYEEDPVAKEEMVSLNKKVYDEDPEIMKIYEKGREWSLEAFEKIYERLGTKFDYYYFERDTGKVGLEYVKENTGKVFEESEGAVVFPGEKYGLHTRVFINSQGLPTYEAKDLGLAETKYKDFPYDESVIVTGNEIKEYFKVVIKALSIINPDLGSKVRHIAHGMVRLPSGKMSSRTGDVISGEMLLDEAKDKLLASYPEMDEATADKVGVGAVKYALLKSTIGSDVVFDFDKSLSFEGDSGPYLQYTYARCQSVLERANLQFLISNLNSNFKFQISNLENEELALLRSLYRFPEVVSTAARNLAPNTIATYLIDLASKFNAFYAKHRILEADEEQRELRLSLTQVVGNILKTGLNILGIQAPEKM